MYNILYTHTTWDVSICVCGVCSVCCGRGMNMCLCGR